VAILARAADALVLADAAAQALLAHAPDAVMLAYARSAAFLALALLALVGADERPQALSSMAPVGKLITGKVGYKPDPVVPVGQQRVFAALVTSARHIVEGVQIPFYFFRNIT